MVPIDSLVKVLNTEAGKVIADQAVPIAALGLICVLAQPIVIATQDIAKSISSIDTKMSAIVVTLDDQQQDISELDFLRDDRNKSAIRRLIKKERQL